MTQVEQFMAEYFHDRKELMAAEMELRSPHRRNYFAAECEWDSRDGGLESSDAEAIVSISERDGETLVVTTGSLCYGPFPLRYHLRPNGTCWLIHKVEFQCPRCHYRGVAQRGGTSSDQCPVCGGKGWQ